ncbi:hypothetical protein [Capybara microvirus Cap1_SP_108]|nr:hypothetical protein [Capybara microvirus Cap1_SP_108]
MPCGQCVNCRKRIRSQWTGRMMMENLTHKASVFITLSYDDVHLPIIKINERSFTSYDSELTYRDCCCLDAHNILHPVRLPIFSSTDTSDGIISDFASCRPNTFLTDYSNSPCVDEIPVLAPLQPRDTQLFLKRLRINLKRQFGLSDKLRYFLCGEYGEERGRPHYHMILFGLDVSPSSYRCRDSNSYSKAYALDSVFRCIQDSWSLGRIECEPVTESNLRYVAKYTTKTSMDSAPSIEWDYYIRQCLNYLKHNCPMKCDSFCFDSAKRFLRSLRDFDIYPYGQKPFHRQSLGLGYDFFYKNIDSFAHKPYFTSASSKIRYSFPKCFYDRYKRTTFRLYQNSLLQKYDFESYVHCCNNMWSSLYESKGLNYRPIFPSAKIKDLFLKSRIYGSFSNDYFPSFRSPVPSYKKWFESYSKHNLWHKMPVLAHSSVFVMFKPPVSPPSYNEFCSLTYKHLKR